MVGELGLRRCFREPVAEIFEAAKTLDAALAAHLRSDHDRCAALIRQADDPVVLAWVAPFLAHSSRNPFLGVRTVEGEPAMLAKAARGPNRMPTLPEKAALVSRHGFNCVFCGIPVIRTEVRKAFRAAYPEALRWGSTNDQCHGAFLCMWLQFDHVLPHSRGGDSSQHNVVVTCSACNYGRMHWTLPEVGLLDPRIEPRPRTEWQGLEAILPAPRRMGFANVQAS